MISSTELLRSARAWHRKVASILFIFFFVISITAILLGWKDFFTGKIYSTATKQKTAKSLNEWLPLDSLKILAAASLKAKLPSLANGNAESMNASVDKGYIRFSFSNKYTVQLNAQNGELQSIEKRAPNWILKLHDGGILDDIVGIKSGAFKTVYSTIIGFALLCLTISGFWMWFKPKQIRKAKKRTNTHQVENIN